MQRSVVPSFNHQMLAQIELFANEGAAFRAGKAFVRV
jgi:hypothetical protein